MRAGVCVAAESGDAVFRIALRRMRGEASITASMPLSRCLDVPNTQFPRRISCRHPKGENNWPRCRGSHVTGWCWEGKSRMAVQARSAVTSHYFSRLCQNLHERKGSHYINFDFGYRLSWFYPSLCPLLYTSRQTAGEPYDVAASGCSCFCCFSFSSNLANSSIAISSSGSRIWCTPLTSSI